MALDNDQIKAVEEASGHSVFGSSSLPRIIDCPASVGEELKVGLRPSSIYAAKGTELHAWTEKSLRSSHPRDYILAQDLPIEDIALILDAVEYVLKIKALHPDDVTMELEATGNLASYGMPEIYGTMDVVLKSANRVDVIDHKFGFGVAVYAEKNYQLTSYLAMAVPFVPSPDMEVELYVHINQPPLNIYDEWRVEWDVLFPMVLGDIQDAITKARSENPPFGPTEKACRFCNANMKCRHRLKSLQQQAALVQQMSNNPAQVSNDQWAEFLVAWASLKVAGSQVEKYAIDEIISGNDFPGYKLIGGRSNRKFIDQEEGDKFLISRLGKKAEKPTAYISLAQAEKVDKGLKKDEEWKALIHKPQGKAKLVKADAKGKALVFGVQSVLDGIAQGKV